MPKLENLRFWKRLLTKGLVTGVEGLEPPSLGQEIQDKPVEFFQVLSAHSCLAGF